MAKRFFYVCAGIFLLALSYHLGARSARAQADVLEGPTASGSFTASIGRVLVYLNNTGLHRIDTPIPGSAPVVATAAGGLGWALLANGDCWNIPIGDNQWTFRGNLYGAGPTPAQRTTFGALKAKYRP